jgi:hypothetical protein
MKSNNIKMTVYERVNFVGGGQKKLGFSSFQVPIWRPKNWKVKKKKPLNSKPYIPLSHLTLGAKNTWGKKPVIAREPLCLARLEQESIFYEWNKKLLFIFVGSTGQVYFHTRMNAQTNRLLIVTYPIVQTMMQRAMDDRREEKRRECMMLVQLKRELNNAQNEASLFVLFPLFFLPFSLFNFLKRNLVRTSFCFRGWKDKP